MFSWILSFFTSVGVFAVSEKLPSVISLRTGFGQRHQWVGTDRCSRAKAIKVGLLRVLSILVD